MLSVFQVGDQEIHRVEVDQPFTASKVTVRVDDQVVVAYTGSLFQYKHIIPFTVGSAETHQVELRIHYLMSKYEAYVDGKLFVANLFPQAIGTNAFILALIAFIMSVCILFSLN